MMFHAFPLVLAALLAAVSLPRGGWDGLDEAHPLKVDKAEKEIRVLADLQPRAFTRRWFNSMPGHHAVVWKGGGAARKALLAAYVEDTTFHDAMVSIGAKPGNNLTQKTWSERFNKTSRAPSTKIEGSPVGVWVWWDGLEKPLPLKDLFKDPGGKGIHLRFGGNKALIPVWRSGCVVCLQSCPGSKIGNRSYTIRDYVDGKATFTLNEKTVPPGKRKAVVLFRLLGTGKAE
ncbi:MAG: YdjY domain-containing protein [Thermodesulfobacteriota bacterium]